jgi:hypothetical protein
MRKTWGWQKNEDAIANSQFVAETGLSKQNVQRSIKRLIAHEIVVKIDYKKTPTYRINRRIREWKTYSKLRPPPNSSQNRLLAVVNIEAHKRKGIKKKKIYVRFWFEAVKLQAGWDMFWAVWSKKASKKAAMKAWAKLNPNLELVERICADVSERMESDEWTQEGRRYCPNPATYINGEKWEDEAAQEANPWAELEARYGGGKDGS